MGARLEKPEQQALAGKWLADHRDANLVQLMILGAHKNVRALAELTPADLANPRITDYIRNLAANQGGSHAVLYYEGTTDLSEIARSMVKDGVLMDAILPQRDSIARELGEDKWDHNRGWMGFSDGSIERLANEVKVEQSLYRKPTATSQNAGNQMK